MRINQSVPAQRTHEGAKAKHIHPELQLKRSVLACLLWEKQFYESGESIADRISFLAGRCKPEFVAQLAIDARTVYKLRHAPLLLLITLVKVGGKLTEDTIYHVINRPDELAELVALYWKDGKRSLPNSMKRGLARAFTKFDEYQLSKWNRPDAIKLRDVMFLVHPKPKDDEQAAVFKKLANKELSPPDTWESRLTAGEDKKEVFTDLLKRNKLGYMALLRNLRNMLSVGVELDLIRQRISETKGVVLPYRFIAAAKHAPQLEPELDQAMIKLMAEAQRLPGKTVLLVDVSYSMHGALSAKSDLNRLDAACGLAILLSGICESLRVFTFSNDVVEVAPRKGMALRDAVVHSQNHGGTYLGGAVTYVENLTKMDFDRLIVLTDEQSRDRVPDPKGRGYMINVASYKNGVGYGAWRHIDGFSEACIEFIQQYETEFDTETH